MKVYKRIINGIEHTVRYDDDEAKQLKEQGVELTEVKAAAAPKNKAKKAASNKKA